MKRIIKTALREKEAKCIYAMASLIISVWPSFVWLESLCSHRSVRSMACVTDSEMLQCYLEAERGKSDMYNSHTIRMNELSFQSAWDLLYLSGCKCSSTHLRAHRREKKYMHIRSAEKASALCS